MPEKYSFINVRFDEEMTAMLDALVVKDTQETGVSMDRSKTVKRLIRQEYQRRFDVLRIPIIPFTGKGDEIGEAFNKNHKD